MTLNKLRLNANEKGFTLIELMIVIAIIGILAAIAIPNFISYRDKAYCSSAESDANAIAAALADYFAIPNNTSMGTLPALVSNDGTLAGGNGPEGLTVPPLSGTNTATLSGGLSNIIIWVRDASGRCPADYRASQTDWAGNTVALDYFVKAME